MTEQAIALVFNVPEYALKLRFWVVTVHNGELWFWGAWETSEEAVKNRQEDQIVLINGRDVR